MAQKLHGKDEKVGGEGIALPNTSRGQERVKIATIQEKGSGHWGNAAHDKLNEVLRDIKESEHLPNKAPLNSIIGFF